MSRIAPPDWRIGDAPAYLDYNATAPIEQAARDAWLDVYADAAANPSSTHAPGRTARATFDDAKARCARMLGCMPSELVVTSGGTESNALAIHSATHGRDRGHVVVSAIEHSSVTENAERAGEVLTATVDRDGRLHPGTFASLPASTRVVCFQWANNETGTLQNVPILVAAIRAAQPEARILIDCCQGAGKDAIDMHATGADFASLSAHKFGGPKGVGLLYVRAGVPIVPMLAGGAQQSNRRSGTEDAANLCALAAALEVRLATAHAEGARQRELLVDTFARIRAELPAAVWIAFGAPRASNTLSLGHPGADRTSLVNALDRDGFAVSLGSACSSGRGLPSATIAALGLDPLLARSVIRVSIGPRTTASEMARFASAYVRAVRGALS